MDAVTVGEDAEMRGAAEMFELVVETPHKEAVVPAGTVEDVTTPARIPEPGPQAADRPVRSATRQAVEDYQAVRLGTIPAEPR